MMGEWSCENSVCAVGLWSSVVLTTGLTEAVIETTMTTKGEVFGEALGDQ